MTVVKPDLEDVYVYVPVFEQGALDPVITRRLDRRKEYLFPPNNKGKSRELDQPIEILESEVIIAALKANNATIEDHEVDILTNPHKYTDVEYRGLADYHWRRISELGGAALELELKNLHIIYPKFPSKAQ